MCPYHLPSRTLHTVSLSLVLSLSLYLSIQQFLYSPLSPLLFLVPSPVSVSLVMH